MKRSKLENKGNKNKNALDIVIYKNQRNYVTKLNKQENLDILII